VERVEIASREDVLNGKIFGVAGAYERIASQERSSRIGESMDALPVPYREVLTLRFEEEMKLEEIAEVLGVPLSTVKTRLRRALDRMRVSMDASYPGETWQ